jgi:hypothetical protein
VLKRIAEEGSAAGGNVIKNSDSFLFNEQFTCPMRKIRIPMTSLEKSHNIRRVEEEADNRCIARRLARSWRSICLITGDL